MIRTKIAAIAIAAVSVIGVGAGLSGTAHAATTQVTQFTFPSNTAGTSAVLSVLNGNPVPSNGTPVTFDLQQFVSDASQVVEGSNLCHNPAVSDSGAQLAADIQEAVYTFETASHSAVPAICWDSAGNGNVTPSGTVVGGPAIPAGDFASLPVQHVPATPNNIASWGGFQQFPDEVDLASAHTTITLYVENATSNTFEVSPTNGGAPLTFYNVSAIDPNLGSSVTWSDNSTTPPPVATRSFVTGGHIVSVGRSTAELGWDLPVHNGPQPNCVLTETFGYGMTNSAGQPHYGYDCSGHGEWWGLAPGHTYDILVLPAGAGASYGNRVPDPNGQGGWINVVTTA